MTRQEIAEFLDPFRYLAAAAIATGGLMHGIGMVLALIHGHLFFWWFWLIFLGGLGGYLFAARAIVRNHWYGYALAVAGPLFGGALIFLGFLYPETRLLILIPGTFTNEIRLIGFITLITEPMAVALAGLCLVHRVWDRG